MPPSSMLKLLSKADSITLLNALFGFFAIIALFTDELHLSFSLILLALLADGLDGIVARKTGKSQIGEYLEAMADMISMSLAPLLFFYVSYESIHASNRLTLLLMFIAFVIYIVASIIRLSSFHIMKTQEYFQGLPASASTIFILVCSYEQIPFLLTLAVIILTALLMVTTIKFPKPDKYVLSIATILILLSIILSTILTIILPWLLFGALLIYVIAGPLRLSLKKKV